MPVITELQARNVKRLRAVQINPDGSLVQITGANAQGKSSVLDSIALGLAGKKWQDAKPIREGADRGEIVVTLDNGLVIKRTITQGGGGGTLTVTDAEGTRLASPQAVLDKMAASLAFDPLEFSRMKPADQVNQLKRVVGLDFTGLDFERGEVFNARRDINRDVESLKARVAKLPVHEHVPDTEVSAAELVQQQASAMRHNDAVTRLKNDHANAATRLAAVNTEIADLEDRLLDAKTRRGNWAQNVDELAKKVDTSKPADVDAITQQLATIDETNRKVRANAERIGLTATLEKASADADKLTSKLAKIDKSKRDQLAAAKFPIEGLSFDDAGVFYLGLPFSQASSAEKLRVSVAMALSMAPDLKVLLIRDGSLLDVDGLVAVAEMAEAAGAQVWVERVDTSGRVGIVIEDGSVVGAAVEA